MLANRGKDTSGTNSYIYISYSIQFTMAINTRQLRSNAFWNRLWNELNWRITSKLGKFISRFKIKLLRYPSNFFLFLNLIEIYIFRENETSLKLRQIFFNVLFIKLINISRSYLSFKRSSKSRKFNFHFPSSKKFKIKNSLDLLTLIIFTTVLRALETGSWPHSQRTGTNSYRAISIEGAGRGESSKISCSRIPRVEDTRLLCRDRHYLDISAGSFGDAFCFGHRVLYTRG